MAKEDRQCFWRAVRLIPEYSYFGRKPDTKACHGRKVCACHLKLELITGPDLYVLQVLPTLIVETIYAGPRNCAGVVDPAQIEHDDSMVDG